ncbi:MAG: hypothetical protein IIV45_00835 [Lachnospiraceae bacterium]|nr:hypothetical protein [Lachnospiraceae bacterium]
MLNEERIILMTKTAAYEEGDGKKNMAIAGYFRSDYIELNLIKSLFYSTIAFVLVAAMVIYYQFEVLLQDIYKMDLLQLGKNILFYYIVFLVVNLMVSYVVSALRYSRAKKSLKHYYNNLRRLSSLYENESKR